MLPDRRKFVHEEFSSGECPPLGAKSKKKNWR
jgi:hypothetical protein